MATVPTVSDMRAELEGYCTTASVISDTWITNKRDHTVIPWIESVTRLSFSGIGTYVEYLSGNGQDVLFLSRKPVIAITEIRLIMSTDFPYAWPNTAFILDQTVGRIKAIYSVLAPTGTIAFPRGNNNIKVTYTAGFDAASIPAPVAEAIKLLTCEKMLGQLASRTGGGDLGVQAWNRSYGPRGKYSHIRDDFKREAMGLLRPYMSNIVGA